MPKFYVQTELLSRIVIAEDAQGAALATVHQVIGDVADGDYSCSDWVDECEVDQVRSELDNQILVSEIGFGRDEAGRFSTDEIIQQWHDLMVAIENMIERLR